MKFQPKIISTLLATAAVLLCQPAFADDDEESKSPPKKRNMLSRMFQGRASYYGSKFHGKRTASGKPFDMNAFTCAHRSLPFGTPVLVKNPSNGAECEVVVTDRGPFTGNRCIDLSKAAAKKLGITGVAKVVCKTGRYVAKGFDRNKENHKIAAKH